MSIIELRKDSEEFNRLIPTASRSRVRDVLVKAKAEVDREIVNLEIKERQAAGATTNGSARSDNVAQKRYLVELSEYAWDQSEKFVKMFITLDGVQNIDESNVVATFTENSMKLLISNMNGKDYGLTVNNLLERIIVEKSYRKVKTGMVAIYMKKAEENQTWSHLTSIQKRLKEKELDDLKNDGSPEDALVNIMKKMYNSGDSKTKQMIAKAWTESQDKVRMGGGNEFPSM